MANLFFDLFDQMYLVIESATLKMD